MSHKADASFFNQKKLWSERKDEILRCYLPPYLAKITKLKAPVLIVDAFAGPGRFDDGKDGSPLIICQAVKEALSNNPSATVSVMCIELINELFSKLETNLSEFPFAEAKQGEFLDCISLIEKKAKTHSVFLYVDPWNVKVLNWDALDTIFQHLTDSNMSIEILMNFNTDIFSRSGLSALTLAAPELAQDTEDAEPVDVEMLTPQSLERLNNIIGGNWWQNILKTESSFPNKVQQIADGVCEQLSQRFKEVCQHGLKAKPHHTVPKYHLIFASRHPDALLLMNDQMVKSQRTLADTVKPEEPTFFEMRSTELIPDFDELLSLIIKQAEKRKTRGGIILAIIRQQFGIFACSEIRRHIQSLLKEGKLTSSTGKTRITNTIEIWKT